MFNLVIYSNAPQGKEKEQIQSNPILGYAKQSSQRAIEYQRIGWKRAVNNTV